MVVARRIAFVLIVVGVVVFGWIFAAENTEPVSIHYGFGASPQIRLWVALAVAFGAGAGLVGLYTVYALTRAGMLRRRYRRAVEGLEAEVHQLRNLPLAAGEAPAEGAAHTPAPAAPARSE